MTAKTALENCRKAAAYFRQCASRVQPHQLGVAQAMEYAAAVSWMAATWTEPGTDAQIAVEVQALARRQLAAMRIPAEHVRQLTKGKAS
jgi:hypothetical protein